MEQGRSPLDFSMNVNPLGIPEEVVSAIAKAARSADQYPDPFCRALIQRLAEHEDIPPEWIFCGNGAADVIYRLARALKPQPQPETKGRRPVLLITAPTFSEYEAAFQEYGWEIRRYPLQEEKGFQIEETGLPLLLALITEDVDAVFLCEPNNPTGVTTDRRLLQRILEHCRQQGTTLIVDECFNGFLEEPETHTLKGELPQGGLVILKAFTKLYGMAGVRLGYGICSSENRTGDEPLVERLRRAGPPWNVSSLAQAAGIAALEAADHADRGVEIVRQERPWMKEQLRRLGIRSIYGEANYLLFHIGGEPEQDPDAPVQSPDAPNPGECLRAKGILIRDCSNYRGLGEGWYRIAIRRHEENEQLIAALREVLKG